MAVGTPSIAPFINITFYVTSEWWTYREGTLHRGLDIATSISQPVYSILNGRVHSLGYNSSRGNWIIIEDTSTHYATLFMHLAQKPSLSVGQLIEIGDYIAMEGSTGTSTGIHLHVEMQDISRFNYEWYISDTQSDYINPCTYMGITNEKGTAWLYNGTPKPIPKKKREHFKFYLYSRKYKNMI